MRCALAIACADMRTKFGTAKSLANKKDFWPALY
jgi:hypothetical protein